MCSETDRPRFFAAGNYGCWEFNTVTNSGMDSRSIFTHLADFDSGPGVRWGDYPNSGITNRSKLATTLSQGQTLSFPRPLTRWKHCGRKVGQSKSGIVSG